VSLPAVAASKSIVLASEFQGVQKRMRQLETKCVAVMLGLCRGRPLIYSRSAGGVAPCMGA
jgi:hypothetical protein